MITPLPTAPSRDRPATFSTETNAFLLALQVMVTQFNASMAGESAAALALNLFLQAAGKGADLVGFDPAANYTLGTLGWTAQRQLSLNSAVAGVDPTGATSSRAAIQTMVALAKSLGVNRLRVQAGTYLYDATNESQCCKIDFNLLIDCEPGVEIRHSFYDLAPFAFVGCTGGGISGAKLTFTGTRPASATGLTSNHFGFNSTGVDSPSNFACHVSLLGCHNVSIDRVQFAGLATTNRKESAIQMTGGTSTGPALDGGTTNAPGPNAVFSRGNKITYCRFDDVYFGIAGLMQDDLTVDHCSFGRYFADAFVGAGHAVYITGYTKNSRFTNLTDQGTFVDTPGTGTFMGASSWQFRAINNCIVANLRSSRVEGLGSIQNNSNDNTLSGWHWSANRVPYEIGLASTPIWNVAQADSTSTQNRNSWSGVYINDLQAYANTLLRGTWVTTTAYAVNDEVVNGGISYACLVAHTSGTFATDLAASKWAIQRSANCPIMGNGGATVVSANMAQNVLDNINITFRPDSGFGKSVCYWPGQNSSVEFKLTNLGSGLTAKSLLQLTGSSAGTLALNTVHWYLQGNALVSYNLSMANSAGSNAVYIHATGLLPNSAATGMVAGDKLITDDGMYANRLDLISSQVSHKFVQTATSSFAVPAPAAELTYAGSRIAVTVIQDGTGGRVLTWNAAYVKAADGAGTANQRATTVFECDTAGNFVQVGGALTYR